jgi:hypothetical protein
VILQLVSVNHSKLNISVLKRVLVLRVQWNIDLNAEGAKAPSATLATMALKLASDEAEFTHLIGASLESF